MTEKEESTQSSEEENKVWLLVSASTFEFWDNKLDAEYDDDTVEQEPIEDL